MRTVAVIQGGGVGLDQERSVRDLFAAAGAKVEFDVVPPGADPGPAVRRHGVALKTKLFPPAGSTANANVAFRKALGLFASVRPVRNLPGLASRFTGVDFLLVREVTEDLYTQSEHEVAPGVVQSFKIVTEAACLRFFRFAFELARKHSRPSVHCIHKANILKLADGLFLDCFRRVAADFPDIAAKDLIVDNACMQMVSKPQQFSVVAAGNLYGDLLGDLGAGLVGGISATAAVNHGAGVTVYEAVYGATHAQVPPDRGNPLPLILPAVELLKDIGEAEAAGRIAAAVGRVLAAGAVRPADLGGTATTREFTAAVAAELQ